MLLIVSFLLQTSGWWDGELNGRQGQFPNNYIREEGGAQSSPPVVANPQQKSATMPARQMSPPVQAAPPPQRAAPPPAAPPPAARPPMARPPGPPKKQARALYDFQGQESGDLSFRAGEIIEITKQDGNWWNGNLGGRTGAFPSK